MAKLSDELMAWAPRYLNEKWEEFGFPSGRFQDFLRFAEMTESPIEHRMLAGLLFCPFGYFDCPNHLRALADVTDEFVRRSNSAIIIPQAQLSKLKWRVDFLVILPTYGRGKPPMLVVECDGHEFHERTKEQAARDRKRDRDLQALGVPILRFTGSEIHRDLDHCIDQIDSFGSGLIKELWKNNPPQG